METINLLILDDNPGNLPQIKVIQNLPDIYIHEALSCKHATEVLYNKKINLIILNPQMANATGFQIAEKIRSTPENQSIPIIFHSILTGNKYNCSENLL
jgi:PleD family two-component response regulator